MLTQDGRLGGYVDVFRALYQDDPTMVAFVSRAALEAVRTPSCPIFADRHPWLWST